MAWSVATAEQIAQFRARGWLAVPDAIPPEVVDDLARRVAPVHTNPALAMRWEGRDPADEPGDHVLQSMLEMVWVDWQSAPFHAWTLDFSSALMGAPARFWYNQLLDKPPLRGAATWWHQDGASVGADVGARMISAWMALDAVDVTSGCMHFEDRGHLAGVVDHQELAKIDCGRGACQVDPAAVVAAPLPKGGLTFHLGLTPHMAPANRSPIWRQVLIQRFVVGPLPQP